MVSVLWLWQDNSLAIQDFTELLLYDHCKVGFRHSPSIYGLTGCKQASLGSGSDLFLIAAGTRAAAENDHYIDVTLRQRYKLKITPLLSHLSQMTGYPAQIHAGITGTAIFQGYLNLAMFL
jgi:hypothetical protein